MAAIYFSLCRIEIGSHVPAHQSALIQHIGENIRTGIQKKNPIKKKKVAILNSFFTR